MDEVNVGAWGIFTQNNEIVAVEQGILGDRPWRHGLLPSLTTFFSARVDVLVNCSAALNFFKSSLPNLGVN